MAIVAGIDEAGYGPLLGPLVVSRAVFEVPDALAEADLWAKLSHSITAKARKRDSRVPIVDSKKLHHSQDGLAALEQTALVMLAAGKGLPDTVPELLNGLSPGIAGRLVGYPWYDGFDDALPLACDGGLVRIKANAVRRELRQRSIQFLGARCCVLPEGQFNKLVGATRNKATVLWMLTVRLISELIHSADGRPVFIFVDRQGARVSYVRLLLSAFEGVDLRVLAESEECSRYELRFDGRESSPSPITIEFRVSAESAHLPTALASIYSKYVRELLMVALNRYWQGHVGGLKRTAGYYQDGLRFLKDIDPAIEALSVDRAMLVRSR